MRPGQVRSEYLTVPWGQVHYQTAAADPALPTLLMCHQSPLSSRRYRYVLPALAAVARPVALDTPGFGASDPPPAEWEVADYADLVWRVADALGARRPVLFGRATGGVFAYAAATTRPDRCAGLILHGIPVYTAAEKADRLAGYAPPYRPDPDGGHLAWIWSRVTGEYPWAGPDLVTELVRDYLAAGPDFATAYRAIWRYDPAPAAAAITAPTLLIHGGRDRVLYMAPRARHLLPAATAVDLPDATDFDAEIRPDRFARVIADFLAPTHSSTHSGAESP